MIFFLAGCAEDEENANNPRSEVSGTSKEEEGSSEKPVRTLTLKENNSGRERDSTETSQTQTGADVPFHAEKGERLAEKWIMSIEPEDFEIGLLEEDSELGRRMFLFFQDFAKGNIGEEYLHPQWKNRIKTIYDSLKNGGKIPEETRIGDFLMNGDSHFFPIRFINEGTSAEGIVYLQKHEGEWLISDIQINPIKIREKTGEEGKFQPSMYQWMGE